MEKKRILLIGGNYFPEPTGIGKYNGEMMKWLAEQGYSCTVVTTFPYYPQWKVQEPYVKRSYWFKSERVVVDNGNTIKIIRCPHYVPNNPSGISRLISEFSFFFSAYLVILLLVFRKQFNYIITVAPPFEIGLLGIFYKMIRGGKFLYHIQDLQVDAARDLGMIQSKRIIDICLSVEKYILRNADWVSTISQGMREKVNKKFNQKTLFFPNWVDIDKFFKVYNRAEIKRSFGFSPTDKVILYSGAIGHKQGLEALLHAADVLSFNPNIKFAICGSGPYKNNLIALKERLNLQNIVFLPLQPVGTFNLCLNMADLHIVIQKKGASDLVLPSKLSTILAVGGVAIVTACKGTSLYEIMDSADMGILIDPENHEDLIDAISNVTDKELEEKGKKARIYAEEHLSSDKILGAFFSDILDRSGSKVKSIFTGSVVRRNVLTKV